MGSTGDSIQSRWQQLTAGWTVGHKRPEGPSALVRCLPRLTPEGHVCLAWRKGAAKVHHYTIQRHALALAAGFAGRDRRQQSKGMWAQEQESRLLLNACSTHWMVSAQASMRGSCTRKMEPLPSTCRPGQHRQAGTVAKLA